MRKRLMALASVLGLSVMLAACAPPVTHGNVTDKSYTAAYSYTYEQLVSVKPFIEIPETHFQPEQWQLELQQTKLLSGWIEVDEYTYDHTKIGQHYKVPGSK